MPSPVKNFQATISTKTQRDDQMLMPTINFESSKKLLVDKTESGQYAIQKQPSHQNIK